MQKFIFFLFRLKQFLNNFLFIKGVRENIDINGTIYYINTFVGYHREEAKIECEAQNMTMVRFETEDKWYSITRWLQTSRKNPFLN